MVESYLGAGKGNVTGKGVSISPSGKVSSSSSSSNSSKQQYVTQEKGVSFQEYLRLKAEADERAKYAKELSTADKGRPVSAQQLSNMAMQQAYKYGVGIVQSNTPTTIVTKEGKRIEVNQTDVMRQQADYFTGRTGGALPNPTNYGTWQNQVEMQERERQANRQAWEAKQVSELTQKAMPIIQHIQLTQSIGEQLKAKGLLTPETSQPQNSINALNNSFLNPYNKNINFWNAGLRSVQITTGLLEKKTHVGQIGSRYLFGSKGLGIEGNEGGLIPESINYGKTLAIGTYQWSREELSLLYSPLRKPLVEFVPEKVFPNASKFVSERLLPDIKPSGEITQEQITVATVPLYFVPYLGEGLLVYGGIKSGEKIIKSPTSPEVWGAETLNILGGIAGAKLGFERITWDVPNLIQIARGREIPATRITEKKILENKQKFPYVEGQTPQQLKMSFYFNPYKLTMTPSGGHHASIKPLPRSDIVTGSESASPVLYIARSHSKRFAGLKGALEVSNYKLTFWPEISKPSDTYFEVPVHTIPKEVPRTLEAMNKFLESPAARNKAWVTPEYELGKPEGEAGIAPGSTFHRQWEQMVTKNVEVVSRKFPTEILNLLEKQGMIEIKPNAKLPRGVLGEFNPETLTISLSSRFNKVLDYIKKQGKVPSTIPAKTPKEAIELVKFEREKTVAHELVHFKQEITWPEKLKALDEILPYKLQPSEIQAFLLEKKLAKEGIPVSTVQKQTTTQKMGDWFDRLVGFQKVTRIEGKIVRIYIDVVGEKVKPKPGTVLTKENPKVVEKRVKLSEEAEYIKVSPFQITGSLSLSPKEKLSKPSSPTSYTLKIKEPIYSQVSSKRVGSSSKTSPSMSSSAYKGSLVYKLPSYSKTVEYSKSSSSSSRQSFSSKSGYSAPSYSSISKPSQTITGKFLAPKTPPLLIPPEYKRPTMPQIPVSERRTSGGGYFIVMREYGKEVKVNARPMTKKQAELFARDIVKQSLTASYKIVPTYQAPLRQAKRTRWAIGEWVSPFRFTEGKSLKTKGFKVEKPGFRIGGLGAKVELKEARMKKQIWR